MAFEANRRVETSARTFAIVERLAEIGQTGVSGLSEDLDMNKGIVHNHLSTLRELGYVTKLGDQYQLSPKLLRVGIQARSSVLYQYATHILEEFADHVDTSVLLMEPAGTDGIITDAYRLPARWDVGSALPLTESLLGVVYLLSSARSVDAQTSFDLDRIEEELTEGYTIGPCTDEINRRQIAIPIDDNNGVCHGCIGVVIPDGSREQRIEDLIESTLGMKRQIEEKFEHDWTGERSITTEKHSWVGNAASSNRRPSFQSTQSSSSRLS